MRRWVLEEHVWTKVLDEAGFTGIDVDVLPAAQGPRTARTLLVTAHRPKDRVPSGTVIETGTDSYRLAITRARAAHAAAGRANPLLDPTTGAALGIGSR
jgi:hypothetical protein